MVSVGKAHQNARAADSGSDESHQIGLFHGNANDRKLAEARRSIDASGRYWSFQNVVALGLFAGALFFSLNGIKLAIGPAPIRSLLLVACGGFLLLVDFQTLRRSINQAARLVAVVLAFGFLGVTTSILAGDDLAIAFVQFTEIHIQALILICLSFSLSLRFGLATIIKVYFVVFGISAAFAMAQAIGFDPAWEARLFIGRLSGDPAAMMYAIGKHERAMGLSYSPVVFANELCIAFILAFYLRIASRFESERMQFDPAFFLYCILFALLSISTGNRSPILGLLVFLPIYLLVTAPRLLLAISPFAIGAAMVVAPVLETAAELGVRAAETSDGSAQNRKVLRDFGIFLIQKNPLGYGLGFNSLEHAENYMSEVIHVPGGDAIRYWPVHNYYVNFLAKYGIFSLCILPFIIPLRRKDFWYFVPFVPYAVHIFYHNTGPISGDPLIFLAITIGFFLARRGAAPAFSQSHTSAEPPDGPHAPGELETSQKRRVSQTGTGQREGRYPHGVI